jgi:hypothetical protein
MHNVHVRSRDVSGVAADTEEARDMSLLGLTSGLTLAQDR